MTLILSLITDQIAMMIADRRLTSADGPDAGSLIDDDANKLICLCGSTSISYTGLAVVENCKTDKWIFDVLAKNSCKHPAHALSALADAATSSFSKIRADIRRQAFVAVGWSEFPEMAGLHPFVGKVSNALDSNWDWSFEVADIFSKRIHVLNKSEGYFLTDTGVTIDPARKTSLNRSIRRAVAHHADPNSLLRILVDGILNISKVDSRVGANLLCVCIPKNAVPNDNGGYFFVANSPNYHQSTFKYFNPVIDKFLQYGPDFVCGGGGWTNFRGGMAPPDSTRGNQRDGLTVGFVSLGENKK